MQAQEWAHTHTHTVVGTWIQDDIMLHEQYRINTKVKTDPGRSMC